MGAPREVAGHRTVAAPADSAAAAVKPVPTGSAALPAALPGSMPAAGGMPAAGETAAASASELPGVAAPAPEAEGSAAPGAGARPVRPGPEQTAGTVAEASMAPRRRR